MMIIKAAITSFSLRRRRPHSIPTANLIKLTIQTLFLNVR